MEDVSAVPLGVLLVTRLTIDWDALLEEHGKSIYWLAQQLDIPYASLHYMLHDNPRAYNREFTGGVLRLLGVDVCYPFTLEDTSDERNPPHDPTDGDNPAGGRPGA